MIPAAAGMPLRFSDRCAAWGRPGRPAPGAPVRPSPLRRPTRSPRRSPPGRVAPPRSRARPAAPPGSQQRARRRSPCRQRPAARAAAGNPSLPCAGGTASCRGPSSPRRMTVSRPICRVRPVRFGGDCDRALAAVHRDAEGAARLVGNRAREERHRRSVAKLGHERNRVLGIRMGDRPVGPGALGDVHGLVRAHPHDVAGQPLQDVDCVRADVRKRAGAGSRAIELPAHRAARVAPAAVEIAHVGEVRLAERPVGEQLVGARHGGQEPPPERDDVSEAAPLRSLAASRAPASRSTPAACRRARARLLRARRASSGGGDRSGSRRRRCRARAATSISSKSVKTASIPSRSAAGAGIARRGGAERNDLDIADSLKALGVVHTDPGADDADPQRAHLGTRGTIGLDHW